jgi:hypothetical protein
MLQNFIVWGLILLIVIIVGVPCYNMSKKIKKDGQ